VDVAEQALASGNRYGTMYPPLLILGGLLHDAGKADEYDFDAARRRFVLTNRGKLVGHKQTVIEWIAAARAEHRVVIADAHYLTLIHMLTAMRGVPDWTGIRKPQALEADALSMADRLSGKGDLHRQMAPSKAGFGGYHDHLDGAPWVVGRK
jgi:3'-5' exoribonuclease